MLRMAESEKECCYKKKGNNKRDDNTTSKSMGIAAFTALSASPLPREINS